MVLLTVAAPAATALTEQQALEAVEAFISGWNSRHPETFARTLHYPHVRPAANGGERVYLNLREYAATTDFGPAIASGWDHSRYDSKRVVHLGERKAHVAGQYTRYRADGSTIWTNQVTYVVTEKDDSIGIQARFAAGFVLESKDEHDASAAAAIEIVKEYLRAFNDRDEQAWVATFNYPHVRLAGDRVTVWQSGEEYMEGFDFSAFAARFDWQRTEWDSIEAVQSSSAGVNVALTATRYDPEGRMLHSFDTFYLVTLQDGHWGIRARSSFAP